MGDGTWSGPFSFSHVKELWREGKVGAHTAYSVPGARARGTLSQFADQFGPSPVPQGSQGRARRRSPSLNAAACAFCAALIFLHPYIEGRLNQDLLLIFFIFPVVFLPFAGAVCFGLRALVFSFPEPFGHWKHLARFWTAFGIAILLFPLAWILLVRATHNPFFLLGLRHRITAQLTPEQLRAIAAKLQQLREASDSADDRDRLTLASPKRYRSKADELRWEEMLVLPGFASLDDYCVVQCEQGAADIWWGSALSFSRGVRVQTGDGARPQVRARSKQNIAPDISVWIGQ